jgi:glycosyltransferase involved in cell wall biosynthesis
MTLLFLSRIEKTKGVFELIEAYARLCRRYPGLRLVMAGEGPARPGLQQRAAQLGLDGVSFPGYIRNAAKAQALVDADLFVLPTYYGEGCPVALLEAMGAGLPCVTNAVGGIPDVFNDGTNGVLLNEVTVDSIADALEELLSDPDRRQEIAKHNRVEAWSRYEARVVIPRIESRLREVANLDRVS